MTLLPALDTPALLVDRARLHANLDEMAAVARAAGISLRPHAKTHKCPAIAVLQAERAAVGLTCATAREAAVFAASGVADIRVAYPLVGVAAQRLRAIREEHGTRMSTVADSLVGVRDLQAAWDGSDDPLPVLIDVDTGYGRDGVRFDDPDRLLDLADAIERAPDLTLAGVLTHGGHAYFAGNRGQRQLAAREEGDRAVAAAMRVRLAGHDAPEVSVGSTPSARDVARVPGVTELRPGTYVFNDGTMIDLEVATPETCALTVLATVVSRPSPDRAFVDAGSKTLSSDRIDHAIILGPHGAPDPDVTLVALSEEHGWLRLEPEHPLAIGDRVRIIPGHVCPAVNLARELVIVSGGDVVDRWAVEA